MTPRVPAPIVVGDIRAQVMPGRGQDKAGLWYWRARKGSEQAYAWTGRATPGDVVQALASILTGASPPPKHDDGPAMDTVGQALDVWWTTAIDTSPDLAASSRGQYKSHARSLAATIGSRAVAGGAARFYCGFTGGGAGP